MLSIFQADIQQIKDRTECFDHFPCNKEECERKHVDNWIKMFILYLPIKTDRVKFIALLMDLG